MSSTLRKNLSVALLLAVLLPAVGHAGYTRWQKNITVHNIEFSKIRYGVEDGDTLVVIGYIKADKTIAGYPCAAGWVHFNKTWDLRLFQLSATTTINNFSYAQGTWIRFAEDGGVVGVFPTATEVQGYLCRGGGGAMGIQTAFYPSGKLRSFFSKKDVLVGDVLCESSLFAFVGLHENGRLRECKLAQAHTFAGVLYKKGSRVVLDENGKVVKKE